MTSAPAHSASSPRAFTLVEVVLALALLAAVLYAMSVFMFSMGELWGESRQQRLFEQHVRAVTRHLEGMLQRGALRPKPERGLRVAAAPGISALGAPRLTFELPAGDRILPWPGPPLPDVECALDVVPERGLVLQWQSRWELGFNTATPRTLVVSPLVRRIDYEYYQPQAQAWQKQSSPVRGARDRWELPSRLWLHFQHDRFSADTVVRVPAPLAALPAF